MDSQWRGDSGSKELPEGNAAVAPIVTDGALSRRSVSVATIRMKPDDGTGHGNGFRTGKLQVEEYIAFHGPPGRQSPDGEFPEIDGHFGSL